MSKNYQTDENGKMIDENGEIVMPVAEEAAEPDKEK